MILALIITIPVSGLIIVGCSIGGLITAMWIGPEKPKTGPYGFDVVTPALHILSFLLWVIALLTLLLIFK